MDVFDKMLGVMIVFALAWGIILVINRWKKEKLN